MTNGDQAPPNLRATSVDVQLLRLKRDPCASFRKTLWICPLNAAGAELAHSWKRHSWDSGRRTSMSQEAHAITASVCTVVRGVIQGLLGFDSSLSLFE